MPAFSPDGRCLAFARYVGSTGEIFLLRVSADLMPEGEPQQLTFMNQDSCNPSWVPDGREVIFSSVSKSQFSSLWSVPVSGSRRPRAYPFGPEDAVCYPVMSLKKNRLVYAVMSSDRRIWRYEIPTREGKPEPAQRFLASTRPAQGVQHFPDGKSVAYGS